MEAQAVKYKENEGNSRNEGFGLLNSLKVNFDSKSVDQFHQKLIFIGKICIGGPRDVA